MILTKIRKNIEIPSASHGLQDKYFIHRDQRNLKCSKIQLPRQRNSMTIISPISRKNNEQMKNINQTHQKKYDYSKDFGSSLNGSFEIEKQQPQSYNSFETAEKRYNNSYKPYQSVDRNANLHKSKQKNEKSSIKDKFCLNEYLREEFGNYKNIKKQTEIGHYNNIRTKNYDHYHQMQDFKLTDKFQEFKIQYRTNLQQNSLHSKAKYQSKHYRKRYKETDQTLKQQSDLISQIQNEDFNIHKNKQNQDNYSNQQKIIDTKIDCQRIMQKIAKVTKLNQDINKILQRMTQRN